MSRFLVLLAAVAAASEAAADVSKEDIRKLVEYRISDDVILAYIRSNGPIQDLTSQDLVELKKAGASDGILVELLRTRKPAKTVAPPEPDLEYVRIDSPRVVWVRRSLIRPCAPRRHVRCVPAW